MIQNYESMIRNRDFFTTKREI